MTNKREAVNEGPLGQVWGGVKSMVGGQGFARGMARTATDDAIVDNATHYIDKWLQINNPRSGAAPASPEQLVNYTRKIYPFAYDATIDPNAVMTGATSADVQRPNNYIIKAARLDYRNRQLKNNSDQTTGTAAQPSTTGSSQNTQNSQITKQQIMAWITDRAAAGDIQTLQILRTALSSI